MHTESSFLTRPIRKEFLTPSGVRIEFFRRSLPQDEAELRLDLEPLFELPTLFQYLPISGQKVSIKGLLHNIQVREVGTWDLNFCSHIDHSAQELRLYNVKSALLSVWRINGSLDALQVSIASKSGAVYIQTGGAGLLEALNIGNFEQNNVLSEILEYFNKPILIPGS